MRLTACLTSTNKVTEIEIVDHKGDWCRLLFTGRYTTPTTDGQLVETWVYKTSNWLPEYPQIPLPIFTEWFVPCNALGPLPGDNEINSLGYPI